MNVDNTPDSMSPVLAVPLELLRVFAEAVGLVFLSLAVRSALTIFLALCLLPLISVLGIWWDIATTTVAVVACAAVFGHKYPERAVSRSIASFPILLGIDAAHFYLFERVFLLDWSDLDARVVISIAMGGMLILAFAVALARHFGRDFRAYIEDHLDEFRESLEYYGLKRPRTPSVPPHDEATHPKSA